MAGAGSRVMSCIRWTRWKITGRVIPAVFWSSRDATSVQPASHTLYMFLQEDLRRQARISKRDVLTLLDQARSESSTDPDRWTLMLEGCNGQVMPDESADSIVRLAESIWEAMAGVELKTEHFNSLLKAYVDAGKDVEPASFLRKMAGDGVKPDRATYVQLLLACGQKSRLDMLDDTLQLMKSDGFLPDEATFGALAYGHIKCGQSSRVDSLLEMMRAAKVTPTAETYSQIVRAYAETGDVPAMSRWLAEAGAIPLSNILKVAVSAVGHADIFDALLAHGTAGEADAGIIAITVVRLVHLGRPEEARKILTAFPDAVHKRGGVPVPFGEFFIREMVKADMPSTTVIDMCRSLHEANPRTLHCALQSSLSQRKVQYALSVMEAMKDDSTPLRPHYFWPLIVAGIPSDIVGEMVRLGVEPDAETMSNYVLPKMMEKVDTEVIISELKAKGCSVSHMFGPILTVLLKQGDLDNAHRLVARYKSRVAASTLVSLLAKCYGQSGDEKALDILQFISDHASDSPGKEGSWAGHFFAHVSAVRTTGLGQLRDAMLRRGMNVDLGNATDITMPHPRDMDLEQLECHLTELRSKQMNTRGVLRRLLLMYCRNRDLKKVKETTAELDSQPDVAYSPGMFAALIDVYTHHGLVDESLALLKHLKKKSFRVDDHKVVDISTLLIKSGRHNEATQLLTDHQPGRNVDNISRNCWHLLSSITDPANLIQFFELLVKAKYCEPSNIILGPLVKIHVVSGNYNRATAEFMRCYKLYRKLPLRRELACHLLRQNLTESLTKIYEATAVVHGTVEATHDMLFNALEVGVDVESKRLIQVLGSNISWQKVEGQCKRWGQEGKLDALGRTATLLGTQAPESLRTKILHIEQLSGRKENASKSLGILQ